MADVIKTREANIVLAHMGKCFLVQVMTEETKTEPGFF